MIRHTLAMLVCSGLFVGLVACGSKSNTASDTFPPDADAVAQQDLADTVTPVDGDAHADTSTDQIGDGETTPDQLDGSTDTSSDVLVPTVSNPIACQQDSQCPLWRPFCIDERCRLCRPNRVLCSNATTAWLCNAYGTDTVPFADTTSFKDCSKSGMVCNAAGDPSEPCASQCAVGKPLGCEASNKRIACQIDGQTPTVASFLCVGDTGCLLGRCVSKVPKSMGSETNATRLRLGVRLRNEARPLLTYVVGSSQQIVAREWDTTYLSSINIFTVASVNGDETLDLPVIQRVTAIDGNMPIYFFYSCLGGTCKETPNSTAYTQLQRESYQATGIFKSSEIYTSAVFDAIVPSSPVAQVRVDAGVILVYKSSNGTDQEWIRAAGVREDATPAVTQPAFINHIKAVPQGTDPKATTYLVLWNESDQALKGWCLGDNAAAFAGIDSGISFPAVDFKENKQQFELLGMPGQRAVVVYRGTDNAIKAQRISADCQLHGAAETLVDNAAVSRLQGAMWSDGGFVIVWQNDGEIAWTRRFRADLTPDSPVLPVSIPGHALKFNTTSIVAWGERSFALLWLHDGETFAYVTTN